MVAGVIPVAFLAKERKIIYKAWERLKGSDRLWQNASRGNGTALLIDKLGQWLNRKHGEINYFFRYGGFLCYLHKFGKAWETMLIILFLWKIDSLATLSKYREALSGQHLSKT